MIDFDDIMARSYRMLRDMEWKGDSATCPGCDNHMYDDHNKSCELAAILDTEDDWKAHIARRNEILAQEGTPSTTP